MLTQLSTAVLTQPPCSLTQLLCAPPTIRSLPLLQGAKPTLSLQAVFPWRMWERMLAALQHDSRPSGLPWLPSRAFTSILHRTPREGASCDLSHPKAVMLGIPKVRVLVVPSCESQT